MELLRLIARLAVSPIVFLVALPFGPVKALGMAVEYVWLGPWKD